MTDRFIKLLLILLAALNVADYLFTARAVYILGVAEANPAMDAALGTPFFALVKLLIIPLTCLVIWRSRHLWHRAKPLICGLLIFVTAAYSAVAVWHVWGQFLF
jgi:hypothetical protein